MKETYYFAYGSNMNLDQMAYRCPAASVVENVKLEGYRLIFCGRGKGCGVATILPEEGSQVEGVLWKITPECEKSLGRNARTTDLQHVRNFVLLNQRVTP